MKIILYCLTILSLALVLVVESKAQGISKITSITNSVDGCNTITCYEGGWCAETLVYCYPKKAVALIGRDNLTPANPIYGSEVITLPAKPLIIKGISEAIADLSEVQSPSPDPSTYVQQPNYIGLTFHTSIEQASSGNGAIVGFALWNNHQITKVPGLSLASSLSLTWDTKQYLQRSGIASRLHSSLRYHLPIASDNHRTFVQSGFKLSSVQYSGSGGYAKFGIQPTIGAGFDFSPDDQSISFIGYFNYGFRSPLYGQQSLTNSTNRIKDGWTSGPAVGIETLFPLNPLFQGKVDKNNKWALIINTEIARPTYQRNAQYYGPALGAELHRFAAIDISIGLARFY